MIVENDNGTLIYRSGEYYVEVCVSSNSMVGVYARHNCPDYSLGNDYVNALLPQEVKDQKCSRCGKINMPEDLQCVYLLFKAGANEDE
jgi:hypothetical protein